MTPPNRLSPRARDFVRVLFAYFILASPNVAEAADYYVDCSSGNAGNGTIDSPWNSFTNPNGFTFQPGDTLSLMANVTCKGTLSPLGSGNATHVIRLMSYPVDSTSGPPVVNGAGSNSSLLLKNQDYWRISRIAFTNPAETLSRRQGILITADDGQAHYGITIDRNEVYDVAGQTDKKTYSSDFASSAGIEIGTDVGSTYTDVVIRDNFVRDCGGGGIKVRPGQLGNYGSNILVTYNTIDSCGGDGIVMSYANSPLINHNVAAYLGTGKYPWTGGNFAGMWVMASHDPVISHNVVYGSIMSVYDSEAFDCDWGVTGTCLVEYNYSHDNAGGAFLDCDGCGTSAGTREIVRYNIFENDCRMVSVGENATLHFYNNVVYCAEQDFEIQVPQTTRFTNNIFIGRSNATLPIRSGITWENNLFETVTPPTENGITGNPMFVKPRVYGQTLGAGFGYKLQKGSLALNSATIIDDSGLQDFFGNPVLPHRPGNIGVYNGLPVE